MKLPIAVAVAATLLAACQEPLCGCSPNYPRIHFMGSVTRASAPVPDANVEAMLSTDGCRFGEAIPNNPNQDSVNAAGHYEIVVLPVRPGSYCARLVARWPQDSAVRASILVEAPSPNTVVVDFTVP